MARFDDNANFQGYLRREPPVVSAHPATASSWQRMGRARAAANFDGLGWMAHCNSATADDYMWTYAEAITGTDAPNYSWGSIAYHFTTGGFPGGVGNTDAESPDGEPKKAEFFGVAAAFELAGRPRICSRMRQAHVGEPDNAAIEAVGINRSNIGYREDASAGVTSLRLHGDLFWAATWNRALESHVLWLLTMGLNPLAVPRGLVSFVSLDDAFVQDQAGTVAWTVQGALSAMNRPYQLRPEFKVQAQYGRTQCPIQMEGRQMIGV